MPQWYIDPDTLGRLKQFKAETFDLTKAGMQLGIEYGLRLVGVILLLVAAWIFAKWVRRWIYRALHRPNLDETLVRFASNFARGAILVLAIVGCMGIFGLDTTSLAAVLGAVGVAIGLALQGSLSNIAAGIMLLVLRPFVVGDVVKIASGVEGKVDEIDLFTTKVDTPDNRRLILPNSQVFGAPIENLTHHARRRVDLVVRTAFDADIPATREALSRAATGVSSRLSEHAVEVALNELSPTGVSWQVGVWVSTPAAGAAKDELAVRIKDALEHARVGIMHSPQTVYQRATPGR